MNWWQYLILVNLYLVLFYVFYGALLRMETFFHLNRIYLVTSALLSFFIPLIHSEWVSNLFITQKVQQTISFYARPVTIYQVQPVGHPHFQIGNLVIVIYATGALILAARFISQLISLKRIINEPEPATAFAFFKNIRIGSDLDNEDIIAAHEDVHARQWHSADVMLIEAIAIINWFNPIVYFYKFGIKHIHEFIADKQALKNGTSRAEYALLLLSQTLKAPAHELVTPFFNGSMLKRRIIMLRKNRSGYRALMKYGLSAPLFMMMLVLSSAAIIKSPPIKLIDKVAERIFDSPASFTDNPPMTVMKTKADTKGHSTFSNQAEPETDPASETAAAVRSDELAIRSATADKLNIAPIMATLDREPRFKGGMLRFYQFLALNLHYPEKMMRYNIQGKVVIAMTVEKDGSLSDFKSVKDVGYGSADEAIRVLKRSPKWEPGIQNGEAIKVRYMLPIYFNLQKVNNAADSVSKVTFSYKEDDYIIPKATAEKDTSRRFNMILADDFDFNSSAVYLVDGKQVPDLDHVDFTNVSGIKLIRHPAKNGDYVTKYGDKALNGVVLIESKNKTQ